jgi:predicted aspartyl protease
MARTPLCILVVVASSFVCSGRSRESSDVSNCSSTSIQVDIASTCGEPATVRAVPFKLYASYLVVVEGRIGAVEKLKFVLDTGVIHSVVDQKVAKKLRLQRHSAQVLNFNRTIAIERAIFPDVQFGPVQVRNPSMLIADLAHFSDFATHVDALIGMDLLSLSNLTIDNDAKNVLFDPLDRVVSAAALNTDPVAMTAELLLQNHPLRLIVDTGLQGVLLYAERVRKRIPELRVEDESEVDIGGRMRAKQMTVPNARLGPTEMALTIWLVNGPPENVLPGIDGFLGTASLKARRIKFNFATNTLSWE